MNVKLGKEEGRKYVVEAVREGLDVCVVVDSGLYKAGNVGMEQLVEGEGVKWIGRGRGGEKRRVGGVGFLVKTEWKVEKLGWVEDTGGWVRVHKGRDSLVIGGIYRAPSMGLAECLMGISEKVMLYREEMVVVVGDFNCRIGKLANKVCRRGGRRRRISGVSEGF